MDGSDHYRSCKQYIHIDYLDMDGWMNDCGGSAAGGRAKFPFSHKLLWN